MSSTLQSLVKHGKSIAHYVRYLTQVEMLVDLHCRQLRLPLLVKFFQALRA